MIENIPRWVHASIKDYIKTNGFTFPLLVEGEDEKRSKDASYAELRIDGPIVTAFGTAGNYRLDVKINMLITAQKDMKAVHLFQDTVGHCLKAMNGCIPIKRMGNTSDDDKSYVCSLQLEDTIDISNFGQIDITIKTQQASLDAAYRAVLEIS